MLHAFIIDRMKPVDIANEIVRAGKGINPVVIRDYCLAGSYRYAPLTGIRAYAGSITEALTMAQHRLRLADLQHLRIILEAR